jgi:undecaprenyl diphosphate synthase
MQSSLSSKLHVGIVMDGNGRWALGRGLTRSQGQHGGVETVRRVAEAAPDFGIGTLTLYAFSCDNWRRPPAEVATLMELLRLYLRTETARLVTNGISPAFASRVW